MKELTKTRRAAAVVCALGIIGMLVCGEILLSPLPISASYLPAQPVMTPKVDNITGAQLEIDWEHSKVHAQHSFKVHYAGAGAGAGEETAVAFHAPLLALGHVHLVVHVTASDESVFEIRENPGSVPNSGTAFTPLNRFRGSAVTSGVIDDETAASNSVSTYNVAEAAAAGLAGGTILHHETIAIATAPPFASILNSSSRGTGEIICAPNSLYVIILTQVGAGVANHEITCTWYETIHADFAN